MTNKTLPSQPRKASTVSSWDKETDVVVVGMGVPVQLLVREPMVQRS